MYKNILIRFILIFACFGFVNPAVAWQNYLDVRIIGNNNLLKPDHAERFKITLGDYRIRLRQSNACDPRQLTVLFPNVQKTRPDPCPASTHPAPTNLQFETKWNPLLQEFDKGYLTGDGWDTRSVKMAVFREEDGGWRLWEGYTCLWTVDGILNEKMQDCRAYVTKLKLGEHTAAIDVYKNGKFSFTYPKEAFTLKDYVIVAVGDSFGSGEGNPHTFFVKAKPDGEFDPFPAKPSMWLDSRCHRSLFSSSGQTVQFLAEKHRTSSFSLVNLACSGAETSFGLTERYKGLLSKEQNAKLWNNYAPNSAPATRSEKFLGYIKGRKFKPNSKVNPAELDIKSQIEQLRIAMGCPTTHNCRRPDAILIYIGVNDVNFGAQIPSLLFGCDKRKKCASEAIKGINAGLVRVTKNLKIFNKNLEDYKLKPTEKGRIYLVGYPNPLIGKKRGESGISHCNDRKFFGKMNATPLHKLASVFGFGISKDGAQWAEENILTKLNTTLETAADTHGWKFIDTQGSTIKNGYCGERRYFNTYEDALKKQGRTTIDRIVDTSVCNPIKTKNCQTKFVFSVPSGTLHPNLFGHNQISSVLNEILQRDLGLISP